MCLSKLQIKSVSKYRVCLPYMHHVVLCMVERVILYRTKNELSFCTVFVRQMNKTRLQNVQTKRADSANKAGEACE